MFKERPPFRFSPSEERRYARHLVIPEIGVEGQRRLKRSSVLVIGAGGLGCPALQYLTAAGIGKIGVIDFDVVEESNLQRQVLFRVSDCGKNKAEVAAETLQALNPDIHVIAYPEKFSVFNADAFVRGWDVIVDGSDNFATRYLINDACIVHDKPFVSGSLERFRGQIGVFNFLNDKGVRGATYRCLFPTPPAPDDAPGCNTAGVLGVLPGIIGVMQATEVLKMRLGLGEVLTNKVLLLDALTMQTQFIAITRDEALVSGTQILSEYDYQHFCGTNLMTDVKEITAQELKAKIDNGENVTLIDVREPFERDIANIGGELIPMKTIEQNLHKVPQTDTVVVYCRSGGRSKKVCELLQEQHGYKNLLNLAGGMLNWADVVDPTMEKY